MFCFSNLIFLDIFSPTQSCCCLLTVSSQLPILAEKNPEETRYRKRKIRDRQQTQSLYNLRKRETEIIENRKMEKHEHKTMREKDIKNRNKNRNKKEMKKTDIVTINRERKEKTQMFR